MRKYRLAIYTDPYAKTVIKEDVDQIGQGLILAKEFGHEQWIHCKELKHYQWHVKLNEGFIDLDGIKLVIGRFTPNGEIIISTITK